MPNRALNKRAVSPEVAQRNVPNSAGSEFRLRHLVFVLGILGLGAAIFPRAQAAWKLHDHATQFANYALCMVGPTGPTTLRDEPQTFYRLVRQRLLTSSPSSRPFAECAPLLASLAGDTLAGLHLLEAAHFVEYAGVTPGTTRLSELEISVAPMEALAKAAWPFERAGFRQLVLPSTHAKEAAHPLAMPRPSVGAGLPGKRAAYHTVWAHQGRMLLATGHAANLQIFESQDLGLNWRRTTLNQPGVEHYGGRCTAVGQPRSFVFAADSSALVVGSLSGDDTVSETRLSDVVGVVNASCDGPSATLALKKRTGDVGLFVCRHAGACAEVGVPPELLQGEFDIARVSGVTVLLNSTAGVVRVRTSRDDGVSWTPAVVAFDYASYPELSAQVKVPSRLLVAGQRIYLYGAAAGPQSYPVLISDDLGASFNTPNIVTGRPASRPVSTAGGVSRVGSKAAQPAVSAL